ncbi:LysM peptidoglycan-binding domain-containing protein [Nibribacter ruber]|uniref:LysM peptidoglycan-binding domain-containing protein n=1 Tax=Nibribacter ruber TaxID=2698458 RepID=A0A6P1NY84_9BACT|nr:LysM peptidoglycan-binding domain-containing protein [Nibribacter ruber]QHL87324.1 LysM peptidoglycan-binding domain-containing protein [Nibribacter ruber]
MGLFDFLKKGEEKPAAKPAANNDFFKNNPNVAAQPAQPAQGAQEYYTVQSGDSLSKIAKHVYGDAQQWHKIHQANTDQIKDPNLIHPGQKLVIPRG